MFVLTSFFVKDIISPNGSVSIVMEEGAKSDDIDSHTKTSKIRVHNGHLDKDGELKFGDENISMRDEPGHQELCNREQAYVARAIMEDINLENHMRNAVDSLRICLAADESIRHGIEIDL